MKTLISRLNLLNQQRNNLNQQLNDQNRNFNDRNKLLASINQKKSVLTEMTNQLNKPNLLNRLRSIKDKSIEAQSTLLDRLIIEFDEKLKRQQNKRLLRTQLRNPNLNWCEECVNALNPEECKDRVIHYFSLVS